MKIKIKEEFNKFSKEEKELIIDCYYKMMIYFDSKEESKVMLKLFNCIEIK